MSRAMREMQLMIRSHKVDVVIETRDARMPLTSVNPAFERMINHQQDSKEDQLAVPAYTKRLIVYNKADLAQTAFQEPLKNALSKRGHDHVLFTDSRSDAEVKRLLKTAIDIANRPMQGPEDRISVLIAGMPNVGKSSILNSLRRVGVRKGKAASTSSMPGHTRRLSTVIKVSESPPVYVYDTPGVMVPFLGRGVKGSEAALKLALTGGIKESLFEGDTVAEYLLWRLRSRCETKDEGYSEGQLLDSLHLPPETPLDQPALFLDALARRLSAMRKGGEPDTDFAGRWLIQSFREGKLGRWTLDGLGRGGEAVDVAAQWDDAREQAREPKPLSQSYLTGAQVVDGPTQDTSPAAKTIDRAVDEAITDYMATQNAPRLEDLSGHQAKKHAKAEQARVRDAKRRAHAVATVRSPGGPISSARRRKYRR